MKRAATASSRVFPTDSLLPVVLVRVDESGRPMTPARYDVSALRQVTSLIAVQREPLSSNQWQHSNSEFDATIREDALPHQVELSMIVAAVWRRRLASRLEHLQTCRVMMEALSFCGHRPVPAASVGELADAAGVSREHFARMLRARGTRASFCAKRLVDVFIVLQVLVMHSMGLSHRRAAKISGVPYRNFLRARQRLERWMHGSTANFRALIVHVDARLSAR